MSGAACDQCDGRGVTREVRQTLYEPAVSVATTCAACAGTGRAMTYHERDAAYAAARAQGGSR